MKASFSKTRSSNFELLRILMMLGVIAHHYVVNSGITENYDMTFLSKTMFFLQCFGFSGKAMINGFLLLTGYFMCQQSLTFRKILRLFAEIMFYRILLYSLLAASGFQTVSPRSVLINCIFYLISSANSGFTGTVFWLYLLIPFLNFLICSLNRFSQFSLVCFLLLYYTFLPTLLCLENTYGELGWYLTVYLIGATVRLYFPPADFHRKRYKFLAGSCILLSFGSILLFDLLTIYTDSSVPYYYLVYNANKPLALLIGLFLFLAFRDLSLSYHPVINKIASTTFGVLQIHAHSDAMRRLLYNYLLKVSDQYHTGIHLVFHAIISVLGIFFICAFLDLLRQQFLEKPFLHWAAKTRIFKICSHFFDRIQDVPDQIAS